MQTKIDTHGYLLNGLRKAAKEINDCVKRKELYFIYYDIDTREVTVNVPRGYSDTKILLLEQGVYPMDQQELADFVVDKIKDIVYNNVKE